MDRAAVVFATLSFLLPASGLGALFLLIFGEAAYGAEISPMRCDATANSTAGGTLELSTGQVPASILPGLQGPHVDWRPPASGASLNLGVAYQQAAPSPEAVPSGAHLDFHFPFVPAADYDVLFEDDHGGRWSFMKDIQFGAEAAGEPRGGLAFGYDSASGSGVMKAIVGRHRITVSVERAGKVLAKETFNLSGLEARDALWAGVKDQVEKADPAVCTTASPPVRAIY